MDQSLSNVELLNLAAWHGKLDQVKRYIEKEHLPVDQPDEYGDTPLHAATYNGREAVVKYLLGKGANPNAANKAGSTPLHKLAICKYEPSQVGILKQLLEHKANPLIRNAAGLIPENLATRRAILNLLLGDKAVTEYVEVPKLRHGKVIGKMGRKLKEIREQTFCQITVPDHDDPSNNIAVTGRPQNVEQAKVLILEASAVPPRGEENEVENRRDKEYAAIVKYAVPKDKHRLIVGPKGKVINELREETGVEIEVPKQDLPDINIVLKGEADDISEAIKRINEITKMSSGNVAPQVGIDAVHSNGFGKSNNRNINRKDSAESKRNNQEGNRDNGEGRKNYREGDEPRKRINNEVRLDNQPNGGNRGGRGGGERGKGRDNSDQSKVRD